MIARLLFLAMIAAALVVPAGAEEALPPPPEGYSWQVFEEVGATFLRPHGWHFKSEGANGTQAYFITREDIDTVGSFSTGMSVNVISEVGLRTGANAVDYASAFIAGCPERGRLIDSWSFSGGAFQGYGCQIILQPKPDIAVSLQLLAIGNQNTDTVYLVSFESPEAEWPEAWAVGEPMLNQMGLEDEY